MSLKTILKLAAVEKSLTKSWSVPGLSEFIDLAELMCHDALDRDESCGGHSGEEHQTEDGEAVRQDDKFSHTAVWEFTGSGTNQTLHRRTFFQRCETGRPQLQITVLMNLNSKSGVKMDRATLVIFVATRSAKSLLIPPFEMLDLLNEQILEDGEEPVAFDSDCREGVCGMCSLTINGIPHGGDRGTTTCQLHMRKFNDGDTITIEPFRAKAFPVFRDLVVDRSGFDKITQAGGFITRRTGSAPDANEIPIPKPVADNAFDFAACIGCGACSSLQKRFCNAIHRC